MGELGISDRERLVIHQSAVVPGKRQVMDTGGGGGDAAGNVSIHVSQRYYCSTQDKVQVGPTKAPTFVRPAEICNE